MFKPHDDCNVVPLGGTLRQFSVRGEFLHAVILSMAPPSNSSEMLELGRLLIAFLLVTGRPVYIYYWFEMTAEIPECDQHALSGCVNDVKPQCSFLHHVLSL